MVKKVAGIDVGQYRFGVRLDGTIQKLAFKAVRDSVKDAQIEHKDTSLSVIGTVGTRAYELMPGLPINEYVGLEGEMTNTI